MTCLLPRRICRLLVFAAVASAVFAVPAAVQASSISLTVHPTASISAVIPPDFQGVSIEWSTPHALMQATLQQRTDCVLTRSLLPPPAVCRWNPRNYTGPSPSALHSSFLNVMRFLSASPQHVGPIIRIGGATTDESFYQPGGLPRPDWYNFARETVDADYAAVIAAARRLHSRLILGISLRLGLNTTLSLPAAAAIARLTDGFRSLNLTIELGNEPELFTCDAQDYRPCGWSWDDYLSEWDNLSQQIVSATPHAPPQLFQAGAFAGGWIPRITDMVLPRQQRVHSASFHRYSFWTCDRPLSIDELLSDEVALAGLQQPLAGNVTFASLTAAIRQQTNDSVAVSFGEGGMLWCLDGDSGSMDRFAVALWQLDYYLAVASLNVSSFVYYMGWLPPPVFRAAPFLVPDAAVDAVEVLPMLYGQWMFAFVSWNAARLVNTTRLDSAASLSSSACKTWTLLDADGNVVVVVINKAYNDSRPVNLSISVASAFAAVSSSSAAVVARVVRLTAPHIASASGIALAGLTFDNTTDGLPRPVKPGATAQVETLTARRSGDAAESVVDVLVPGGSVAAVVLSSGERGEASWRRRRSEILRFAASPASTTARTD